MKDSADGKRKWGNYLTLETLEIKILKEDRICL